MTSCPWGSSDAHLLQYIKYASWITGSPLTVEAAREEACSTISITIPAQNPPVDFIKPELKPTPTADTEQEPMPAKDPQPEATSVQELDSAAQSDQVCVPVRTSVSVGALVELDEEEAGHPILQNLNSVHLSLE